MLLLSLLLLASDLVSARGAIGKRSVVSSPSPFQAASSLTPSSHVLSLTSQKSAKGYNARSAAHLLHHRSSPGNVPISTHSTGLLSLIEGEKFATNITFGTQTFEVIVDTGSSDTWLAESGFQCVNITNAAPLSEADCYFGPTFDVDETFSQIPGENFNITYGDGEFLTGIMGYENVTLAGIEVRQEVALVNYAAWEGDSTTSGLVGLAYPSLWVTLPLQFAPSMFS